MVIDFSKINIKDNPTLILRNNDGIPVGALGYAHNIVLELYYNEVSKLTFSIPACVENQKTPYYEDVVGMRIIDIKDIGQFILINPQTINDGIKEIKECTAYSLDREFTHKQITLENATYNFWNPASQNDTILGIIIEKMPSWSVGSVDSDLIGKYRTFDVNNENLYNFMKSKLQETYQCIFDFDTYDRRINVRSVNSIVVTEPVFFSLDNLIKEIEITEDTESIITCLDVSGADGVDIRSVNPMGTNKIYDFGYFVNSANVSDEFINKYNSWRTTYENYQLPYYNLTVEHALKTTESLTEQAALSDLNGQLKNLENQQAVIIQSIAQKLKTQNDLNDINQQIVAKNSEINIKKSDIASIDLQINELTNQMIEINQNTAFPRFFTDEEILLLDKYTKEESLAESSFIPATVKNYNTADLSSIISDAVFNITNAKITKVINSFNKELYSISGGMLSVTLDTQISAEVIKASYEIGTDNTFLFTAYFKSGNINGSIFESGCVSLTGLVSSTSSDTIPDEKFPEISNGSFLTFAVVNARFYFTQNTTIYEQRSVEWDLYDYGRDCLNKLAYPSYSFVVSMGDFLALDEFISFKSNIMLGNKAFLKINEEDVLQPIAIKCVIDFENPDNFEFEFSNTYKVSDKEFETVDLLQQSISMGNKVDLSQFAYSAWVDSGAKTQVAYFINSTLDVAKNNIISSRGQAPTFDETGLRIRKKLDNGEFDPRQLWAVSNSLMFTKDNWNTAEVGIGEFYDDNCGICWGFVGKMIAGTMIAGNNLVIESAKKDGSKAVFRVDGNGAALHNATFDLFNGTNTQITLNPYSGFAIGNYPLYSEDEYTINENNAKFWIDIDGNIHYKGVLDGATGLFSGALKVGGDTGFRVDNIGNLSIGGTEISPNFYVSATGVLTAKSATLTGDITANNLYFRDGSNVRTLLSSTQSQIPSNYLNLKGLSITNNSGTTTFSVDLNGNVSINGNITMGSGSSITWNNLSSSLQNTINDISSTADDAYDNRVTSLNVFDTLTAGGTRYGIFSESTASRLYINADYIRAGTIDAGLITLESTYGGFGTAQGYSGMQTTYGAKMFGRNGIDGDQYIIVTNVGCRMQSNANTSFYCTGNNIIATTEIQTGSDMRIKNSISYAMDKYEDFFMTLKPSYFKYNDGTSNRYHVGYIAQDIETSLTANGLTTQDFAGLVIDHLEEDNKDGYKDEYRLRYSEFVALNTYMIQKLNDRIVSLEERLK